MNLGARVDSLGRFGRKVLRKMPLSYHLRELVIHTKSLKCEDKYDRVYALLGLLKDDAHQAGL